MPSLGESTCLEDVPSLCPLAAHLINSDIAMGLKSSSMNGDDVTITSGHYLSANGEQDGLKVQDESYHESDESSESDMENGEVSADQRNWVRPDLPSRCTWRLGAPISESPHSHPAR